MKRLQLKGKTFGRLYVFADAPPNDMGWTQFWVRCTCKSVFIAVASRLVSGSTQSCGCIKDENCSKMGKSNGGIKGRRDSQFFGKWKRDKYVAEADKRIAKRAAYKKKYGVNSNEQY